MATASGNAAAATRAAAWVAVGEGDPRAFRGKAGGHVRADSATRTCDERRSAGKSVSHAV